MVDMMIEISPSATHVLYLQLAFYGVSVCCIIICIQLYY